MVVKNVVTSLTSASERLFPKGRTALTQISDFVRANPIVTGAGVGTIGTLAVTGLTKVRTTRKKRKRISGAPKTRRKTKRKRKTKAKRRTKTKRVKRRRYPRRIRGRGLGSHEIKHTRRGTKQVSFRTKSGKIVRFRTKGTSRRRRGFGTRRGIRR